MAARPQSARQQAQRRRRASRNAGRLRLLVAALVVVTVVTVAVVMLFGGGSTKRVVTLTTGDPTLSAVDKQATTFAAADTGRLSTLMAVQAAQAWMISPATAGNIPLGMAVARAGSQRPEVALTFDDGPSVYTQRLLDVLHAEHATATFFLIGRQIAGNESLLRESVANGNEIGDHTWAHQSIPLQPQTRRAGEVLGAAEAIRHALGVSPRLFRPPYGAMTPETNRLVRSLGMLPVVWNVDSRDWVPRVTPTAIVASVLTGLEPGAIIILHDGGGDRSATIAALPRIIAAIRARGLEPVTVTRLLNDAPPGDTDLLAHM
jgi:peptidoglycan-N-acetylglucosamine deacetylase